MGEFIEGLHSLGWILFAFLVGFLFLTHRAERMMCEEHGHVWGQDFDDETRCMRCGKEAK